MASMPNMRPMHSACCSCQLCAPLSCLKRVGDVCVCVHMMMHIRGSQRQKFIIYTYTHNDIVSQHVQSYGTWEAQELQEIRSVSDALHLAHNPTVCAGRHPVDLPCGMSCHAIHSMTCHHAHCYSVCDLQFVCASIYRYVHATVCMQALRAPLILANGSLGPPDASLFVDVGGNIGWHALVMACSGFDTVSFEAMDENQRLFRSSVCENVREGNATCARHLTLFGVGLGDKDQTCRMVSHHALMHHVLMQHGPYTVSDCIHAGQQLTRKGRWMGGPIMRTGWPPRGHR